MPSPRGRCASASGEDPGFPPLLMHTPRPLNLSTCITIVEEACLGDSSGLGRVVSSTCASAAARYAAQNALTREVIPMSGKASASVGGVGDDNTLRAGTKALELLLVGAGPRTPLPRLLPRCRQMLAQPGSQCSLARAVRRLHRGAATCTTPYGSCLHRCTHVPMHHGFDLMLARPLGGNGAR